MFNEWLTDWFRWIGGVPVFRIFGKARPEKAWRVIDVFVTSRRNADSSWPLWRGTCITWTAQVIVVGWDFARGALGEQLAKPASRLHPAEVAGGRLDNLDRRAACGVQGGASADEILAHECGHTWQALRLGAAYLPLVGALTLFGEGPHSWNHFENEASAVGQFGGLVNGSVCPTLRQPLDQ
jgi:hypothetical protein